MHVRDRCKADLVFFSCCPELCTRIVVSSSVRNIENNERKAKHNESKDKRKDRQEKRMERMEKREDRKQKSKERKKAKKHRQVRRRSKKSPCKLGIPRSKRDLVKGVWGRKRGTYGIVA